ncbi:MAG: hypothetical protein GYA24_11835 [Candidatus Lokiarchaeota archaeon]|nr:hypothetical protein [Candidatus Lokiarchaeota archaeon]
MANNLSTIAPLARWGGCKAFRPVYQVDLSVHVVRTCTLVYYEAFFLSNIIKFDELARIPFMHALAEQCAKNGLITFDGEKFTVTEDAKKAWDHGRGIESTSTTTLTIYFDPATKRFIIPRKIATDQALARCTVIDIDGPVPTIPDQEMEQVLRRLHPGFVKPDDIVASITRSAVTLRHVETELVMDCNMNGFDVSVLNDGSDHDDNMRALKTRVSRLFHDHGMPDDLLTRLTGHGFFKTKQIPCLQLTHAQLTTIPGARFIAPDQISEHVDTRTTILDIGNFCGNLGLNVQKSFRILVWHGHVPTVDWEYGGMVLRLLGEEAIMFAFFDEQACVPVDVDLHDQHIFGFALFDRGTLETIHDPALGIVKRWRSLLEASLQLSLESAFRSNTARKLGAVMRSESLFAPLLHGYPITWGKITKAIVNSLRHPADGDEPWQVDQLLEWISVESVPDAIIQKNLDVVVDFLDAFLDIVGFHPEIDKLHDWFAKHACDAHCEAIMSRASQLPAEPDKIIGTFSFLAKYLTGGKGKRLLRASPEVMRSLATLAEKSADCVLNQPDLEVFLAIHNDMRKLVTARNALHEIEAVWNGLITAKICNPEYLEQGDLQEKAQREQSRGRYQLAIAVLATIDGYDPSPDELDRIVHGCVAGLLENEAEKVLDGLEKIAGKARVIQDAILAERAAYKEAKKARRQADKNKIVRGLLHGAPLGSQPIHGSLMAIIIASLVVSVPLVTRGISLESELLFAAVMGTGQVIVILACLIITWKFERVEHVHDCSRSILKSMGLQSIHQRLTIAHVSLRWIACASAGTVTMFLCALLMGRLASPDIAWWLPAAISALAILIPAIPGITAGRRKRVIAGILAIVCTIVLVLHAVLLIEGAFSNNHLVLVISMLVQLSLYIGTFYLVTALVVAALTKAVPAIHERLARLARRQQWTTLEEIAPRAVRISARHVLGLTCVVLMAISFVYAMESSISTGADEAARLVVGGDAWLGNPAAVDLSSVNPYTNQDLQRLKDGATLDGQPLVKQASLFRRASDMGVFGTSLECLGVSIARTGWCVDRGSIALVIIDPATYPASGFTPWTRPVQDLSELLDKLQDGGIILGDELEPVIGAPQGSNVTVHLEGMQLSLPILAYIDALPGIATSAGLAGREPASRVGLISWATYRRAVDRMLVQYSGITVEIPFQDAGNPYVDDDAHRHFESLFMPIDVPTIMARFNTWEYRSSGVILRSVPLVIDAMPRNNTFKTGNSSPRVIRDSTIVGVSTDTIFEPEPCEFVDFHASIPAWKRGSVLQVLDYAEAALIAGCVVNDRYVERRSDGSVAFTHDFSPGDKISVQTGASFVEYTVLATIRSNHAYINGSAGSPFVRNPRSTSVNPFLNATSLSWITRGLSGNPNAIIMSDHAYQDVLRQTLAFMQGKYVSSLPWYAPGGGNVLVAPWYTEMMKFFLAEHDFCTGFRFDFSPSVLVSRYPFYAASLQAHLRGVPSLQNATCYVPVVEYKRLMRHNAGGVWMKFNPVANGRSPEAIISSLATAHASAGLPFDASRVWLAASIPDPSEMLGSTNRVASWWWTGAFTITMGSSGYLAGRERASMVSLVHASMKDRRGRIMRLAFTQAAWHAIMGMVGGLLAGWGMAAVLSLSFPFMAALPLAVPAISTNMLLATGLLAAGFMAGLLLGTLRPRGRWR